jgi:molybdenum cofactor guanylyltransferase
MRAAGVVLVGGRSSRMGTEKAALEWHGSTLLRRTVGILGREVHGPVIVVRAAGQPLPALDVPVDLREDPVAGRGPLQGIAVGLAAARDRAELAFVCSVDLPLLHPAFVHAVLAALAADAAADVALPHVGGHRQPLLAAYRTALAIEAAELLAAGRPTPGALFARSDVRHLDEAVLLSDPDLAAVDPELASATNVNRPEDYARARALPPPDVTVWRGTGAARSVRAATLGAAAAAVGMALPGGTVTLGGRPLPARAEEPLISGDEVGFPT